MPIKSLRIAAILLLGACSSRNTVSNDDNRGKLTDKVINVTTLCSAGISEELAASVSAAFERANWTGSVDASLRGEVKGYFLSQLDQLPEADRLRAFELYDRCIAREGLRL